VIGPDRLRPPGTFDPAADAYKDWLHLNVFDHASGIVGLVNTSLHGSPHDLRSRAAGTALLDVPGVGWVGNVSVGGFNDARIGVDSIGLDTVALSVSHRSGTIVASARMPDEELALTVSAEAGGPSISLASPLPLGPEGWVSWYLVPRLAVRGEVVVAGERISLDGASAYHDHNWGRWHWGDDLGWEWGSFLAPAGGATVVVACVTDRAHRRREEASAFVRAGDARRSFGGRSLSMAWSGELQGRVRRLPGALAALHQDRAAPRLPAALEVTVDDGTDAVELQFTARSAVQLILADPVRPGYSFLHELAGTFAYEGRIAGVAIGGAGLGVAEYLA